MNESFVDAIYLFACGAKGCDPVLIHELDVFNIYELAKSQDIWPIVFLALKKLYDRGQLHVDMKTFTDWHKEVIIQAVLAYKRSIEVSNTIHELEQQGIKCCVLKGEVYSRLYHNPICRISSDADILIDANSGKKAADILRQNGFSVASWDPATNQVRCIHPVAGLIELHLHLYEEICEDVWFDRKILNTEPYRCIKTNHDTYISTLGINDGLIFNSLHLIKHFLSRGAGIRQLMDLLLYMKQYKYRINWDRYNELINYLKFNKFIDSTIGIGIECLGFNANELPRSQYDYDIIQKILADIENGGIFGNSEIERKDFYKLYTEARFNRFKQGSYEKYMKPSVIRSIFPSKNNMSIKYPSVMKNELFLFAAWMQRLWNFFLDVAKKEKAIKKHNKYYDADTNDIVNKRMDLIRELDMI